MRPPGSRRFSSPLILATALGAGAVLGGSAVALLGRPASAPRAAPSATRASEELRPAARPAFGLPRFVPDADSVRTAVREELRAALAAETGTAAAPVPAPPAAPPPPSASFEAARTEVKSSLARGTFTERDRDQLRARLDDMSDDERTSIIRQVLVAMNAGHLRIDYGGPLF